MKRSSEDLELLEYLIQDELAGSTLQEDMCMHLLSIESDVYSLMQRKS